MRSWRMGSTTELGLAIVVSLSLGYAATYLFGIHIGLGTALGAVVFVYRPFIGAAIFWTAVAAGIGLSTRVEPADLQWLVAHWTPVLALWTGGLALITGAWLIAGHGWRMRSSGAFLFVGMLLTAGGSPAWSLSVDHAQVLLLAACTSALVAGIYLSVVGLWRAATG